MTKLARVTSFCISFFFGSRRYVRRIGWAAVISVSMLVFAGVAANASGFSLLDAMELLTVRNETSVSKSTALVRLASPEVSNGLVISQVYGGGGNAGAPYTHDFIEIFNRGTTTVSLSGLFVQFATATTNFNNVSGFVSLSGSLSPGNYFLVQMASGGAIGVALPTPDATGSTNMGASSGKVAIVSTLLNNCGTTAAQCSFTNVIDFVGYGAAAQQYEGTQPAPDGSNTTAVLRAANGCTETDQSGSDFATGPPTPRNSSSPANP